MHFRFFAKSATPPPWLLGLHITWITLATVLGCAASPLGIPIATHPISPSLHATLYGGDGDMSAVSIQRMASHGDFLYVALTDRPGHERLDVWNVRQPHQPRRTGSLDFGSVLTNGVMFVPLALIPFDGGLLIQTRQGLATYRLDETESLVFERTLPDLTNGLGLGMTQLHLADRHGSLLQQVIPNSQITADPAQAVHRQIVVDFSSPEQPRLLWAGPEGPAILSDAPVTQGFGGHPASFETIGDGSQVRLRVFEPQRQKHRQTFWRPKLERILSNEALRAPLRELLARALPADSLAQWQTQGLQRYATAPGRANLPLADLLLAWQAPETPLVEVFAQHGIHPDTPLGTVIAQVLARRLEAGDDTTLSAAWHAPALQGWLGTVLAPQVLRGSVADTRAEIQSAFNADFSDASLIRYLTLEVIAPLIGDPEFMHWTLRDLIQATATSEPGELVTALLRTCGGFGAVNGVLDTLRNLLEWVPGLDWPHCARYPESVQELLHLALFSWNGASADHRLELDGLAWFELLKFHRYLTGQSGFSAYVNQVRQRLIEMQSQLGSQFAGRVSPALSLDLPELSLPDAHAIVARRIPSGAIFGRLVAQGFLNLLPPNLNIDASTPVGQSLGRLGLPIDLRGQPTGTMADLVTALGTLALPEATSGAVLSVAAQLPTDLLHAHLEQAIRAEFKAAFHFQDLDRSLLELIQPGLDFDIDLPRIVGSWMGGLLDDVLGNGPTAPAQFLRLRHAFQQGDCIAQWLVTLDAVAAGTSWMGLSEVPLALEYALSEAYQAGTSHLVHTVFGILISQIVEQFSGDETLWLSSQLEVRERTWIPMPATPGVSSIILGSFAWQNRTACLVQHRHETNWFGPRTLSLVLCHPDDPENTREVFDLGRWSSVHQVLHQAGAVYVGGQSFTAQDTSFPSGHGMLIDLDSRTPRAQHWESEAPLQFATGTTLAALHQGASLALAGVDRVFLVANPAGAVPAQSEPARAPRFSGPPSWTKTDATTMRLQLRASGTAPLEFLWRRNGSLIPGESSAFLDVVQLDDTSGISFQGTVRNASGEAQIEFTLADLLRARPGITQHPAPATVLAGQAARFSVSTTGFSSPQYQWYLGDRLIPGALASDLLLPPVRREDAGLYSVEVSSGETRLRSRSAALSVLPRSAPRLVRHPHSRQASPLGTPTALSVTAVGWGALEYQWSFEDRALPAGRSHELLVGPLTEDSTGIYRMEVRDLTTGFVATEEFSVAAVSEVRLGWRAAEDGSLQLAFTNGEVGHSYLLERSHDLERWESIPLSNPAGGESGLIPLPETAPDKQPPSVYYRLRTTVR